MISREIKQMAVRLDRALRADHQARQVVQEISSRFGEMFRAERDKQGLKLRGVAKELGISKSMLSYMECGKRLWDIVSAQKAVEILSKS